MSSMKYWMWLSCLKAMRPKARNIALEYFGDVTELFFAGEDELSRVEGLTKSEQRSFADKSMDYAMRALDFCQREEIQIIVQGDSTYPSRLMHIYDPPTMLFVRGRLPVVDEEAAIAIVGTRKSTPYGTKMATRLGYEITKGGGLVISGLAEGIDANGAIGALRAGGGCIGVMGTGIDKIYPKSSTELFRDVVAVGAVISEYPPGAQYSNMSFPLRNRIISGLSVGVVVVEAPKGSGALITANHAMEQGRDIFAVPGNADAENCRGSNALLRDCAKLTTSGWDVLSEYQGLFPYKIKESGAVNARMPEPETRAYGRKSEPAKPESGENFVCLRAPVAKKDVDNEKDISYIDLEEQLKGLSPRQLQIIAAIDETEAYADSIIEKTGLAASAVMAELTMLELLGFVTPVGFNQYRLNIMTK